jgi:hypothetical protein
MGHVSRYYNRLATVSLDVLPGSVKAVPSMCAIRFLVDRALTER